MIPITEQSIVDSYSTFHQYCLEEQHPSFYDSLVQTYDLDDNIEVYFCANRPIAFYINKSIRFDRFCHGHKLSYVKKLHSFYLFGYLYKDFINESLAIVDRERNIIVLNNPWNLEVHFDSALESISPDDFFKSQKSWKSIYLRTYYPEVDSLYFYRDVFPAGSLQKAGKTNYYDGKTNAIAIEITGDEDIPVKRHMITDDLEEIDELVAHDNFILLSPISYIGKNRKMENARYIYGIAMDLDGVDDIEKLLELDVSFSRGGDDKTGRPSRYPRPTYIVDSGNGLHLYWLFQDRLRLYPNVFKELSNYKNILTHRLWDKHLSSEWEHPQYQPLAQGFRMVGTVTKNGQKVRAFKTGDKVDIDFLNLFVSDENKLTFKIFNSTMSLNQAKERYPEWYQTHIVEQQECGHWTCNRAVYDWWLKKIKNPENVTLGHRYYCVMCLAVYAKKSGISKEELEKDAYSLVKEYDRKTQTEDNHFTYKDVLDALEMYDDDFYTFPIHTIESLSGIRIDRNNRRNGRDQKTHLKRARAVRDVDCPDWNKKGNGRKPKLNIVKNYIRETPNPTKYGCVKTTGLAKSTVYKWWDQAKEELIEED